MNPALAYKDETLVLANGETFEVKKGSAFFTMSSGANKDPAVFSDPETFKPGRANAEKLMTWNNELSAIRECDGSRPCAQAPRGCPGTAASLRIATEVVRFFSAGIPGTGTKSEL